MFMPFEWPKMPEFPTDQVDPEEGSWTSVDPLCPTKGTQQKEVV